MARIPGVAVAVAKDSAAAMLIRPLAWELPYVAGIGVKKKKKSIKEQSYSQRKSFKQISWFNDGKICLISP